MICFEPRWIGSPLALCGGVLLAALCFQPAAWPGEVAREAGIEFFEKRVRPVLAEHCFKCHGPVKQFAELRLDSREGMLEGGDTGPAIVPGDAEKSLLVEAVRHGDVQMPPNDRLEDHEIAAIEEWVRLGAPWPEQKPSAEKADPKQHWAFQAVKRSGLPSVESPEWVQTPVDQFILARLEAEGLRPSPPAGRRELIRRVTYDLIGLPPTPEEVQAFERDSDPAAYVKVVERLLASPHYGEQWGRLWLDVARYSDTKGYVYAREEKAFVHAPTYRDWVVRSLNDDLPYDRFVQLQIAADVLAKDAPADLAAMGFLTLGRRFLGVTPDIVDDRIDVVTRGLLGLTVACARCHDHKYDPIPTADYYSLYGVFQNCTEELVQIEPSGAGDAVFQAELERRQRVQRETFAVARGEVSDRVRSRITDYLVAQTELEKYHGENFDIVIAKEDLIPLTVRRWESYLGQPERAGDPLFGPWTHFAALPAETFAMRAADVVSLLQGPEGERFLPEVRRLFERPPASMREVAERYGGLLTEFDRRWRALPGGSAGEIVHAILERGVEAQSSPLVRALYGPESPCVLPDEHISTIERMMDNATCNLLWNVQGEVDRWIVQSPSAPAFATTLTDKASLTEQRIFRRGNPALQGEVVPRRFLEALSGDSRVPFEQGSGRVELARAIADPGNPLTARVWVNRVWAKHFGAGLVRTPSDFGVRAEPPSHPELLDWLADRFVNGGWSTKDLHRLMVLSNTYRQQSRETSSTAEKARQVDPQNRLLWRMNVHRLSFEELRDTWLAVAGDLDCGAGGRSTELFAESPRHRRRTLYGSIDRQFVPTALRMFDFANPDLHSPQRSETTVPQQALFALNHPVVAHCARSLASRLPEDSEGFVREAYREVFQRASSAGQVEQCLAFLASAAVEPEPTAAGAEDWRYGYGEVDAATGKVLGFTALPHFTGEAWQGGARWPDDKLGWVQLTAEGGHAGNDLQHAAIRRWVAPAAMTISVTSQFRHEVAAGDGVRSRVISSRRGLLRSEVVHNSQCELNIDSMAVEAGDTLDFVVDFHANLNSDQFLWAPVIRTLDDGKGQERSWDARAQFGERPIRPLTPREQLVQVLLLSNELMFVD